MTNDLIRKSGASIKKDMTVLTVLTILGRNGQYGQNGQNKKCT